MLRTNPNHVAILTLRPNRRNMYTYPMQIVMYRSFYNKDVIDIVKFDFMVSPAFVESVFKCLD